MIDFPASPTTGQLFTASGTTWRFDGTSWSVAFTAGSSIVFTSDTPPASPSAGTLWFDTVGSQMYVWYVDPNTAQWVPTSNSGGIGEAPTDGQTYGRSLTAWTPVTSPVSFAANIGRNLLHNSLMNIQQRGQGNWTTNGAYTADRWLLWASLDTPTISIQVISDPGRAQIGDEAAQNCLQNNWAGSSSAGAYNLILQKMENVRRFSGKTFTLSFWAWASAPIKVGIAQLQNFGTGGSPSAPPRTGVGVINLAATWARYSITMTMPSTAGKTFGTTLGTDYQQIEFWFSDQANSSLTGVGVQSGGVALWGIQLEAGSQATGLEHPEPHQDWQKCLRYYFTGRLYGSFYQSSGLGISSMYYLPVVMRALPTVGIVANNCTNLTGATLLGLNSVALYSGGTASATGGGTLDLSFTASADL